MKCSPLHCLTNLEGYNCQVHIWSCSFQTIINNIVWPGNILYVDSRWAPSNGGRQQAEKHMMPAGSFLQFLWLNLHKPCIGPFLVVACPLSPSLSTLTPAEDPSFPLLRFILIFPTVQLLWHLQLDHTLLTTNFRNKVTWAGGFHSQPSIYRFEGHLRFEMSGQRCTSFRVGRKSLHGINIVYYGSTYYVL